MNALDARRHGRRPAVGGLTRINVEVVVGEYRAAHRCDQNRTFPNVQLFNDLGDNTVGGAMRAAGTVMGMNAGHDPRPLVN